jgi:CDP-glycerol glycerophosphotransferase (TagB/SpsB family)
MSAYNVLRSGLREVRRQARALAARTTLPLVPSSSWWLFGAFVGERFADNSAALFRYVRTHRPDIPAAFVLSRRARFLDEAQRCGPVLFMEDSGTDRAVAAASVLVISHGIHDLPGYARAPGVRVRLGHGLTGLKRTRSPRGFTRQNYMDLFDLVPVASAFELENKASWGIRRDRLEVLGVCRFDELRRQATSPAREVLYLPTWRDTNTSAAIAHLQALITDERLHAVLRANNVVLRVLPHPMLPLTATAHGVVVVEPIEIGDAIARAMLLVTDYSGVAWDMLLLRRPVVFFVPDLESVQRSRGLHIDLRSDAPGRCAETVAGAVEAISAALREGFDERGERWRQRAIAYDDDGACARVVAAIERRIEGRMVKSGHQRRFE